MVASVFDDYLPVAKLSFVDLELTEFVFASCSGSKVRVKVYLTFPPRCSTVQSGVPSSLNQHRTVYKSVLPNPNLFPLTNPTHITPSTDEAPKTQNPESSAPEFSPVAQATMSLLPKKFPAPVGTSLSSVPPPTPPPLYPAEHSTNTPIPTTSTARSPFPHRR